MCQRFAIIADRRLTYKLTNVDRSTIHHYLNGAESDPLTNMLCIWQITQSTYLPLWLECVCYNGR